MLSTTPFANPRHSIFVILGLLASGCFEELGPLPDFDDEVGEETDDTDGDTGDPSPC